MMYLMNEKTMDSPLLCDLCIPSIEVIRAPTNPNTTYGVRRKRENEPFHERLKAENNIISLEISRAEMRHPVLEKIQGV